MGANSFLAKIASQDPIQKAIHSVPGMDTVLRFTDPLRDPMNPTQSFNNYGYGQAQAYKNRLNVPNTPGPYVGTNPSLALAASGYTTPPAGSGASTPAAGTAAAPAALGAPNAKAAQIPAASAAPLGNALAPDQYARRAAAAQRAQTAGNPWASVLGGQYGY